jgi:diacylglycerol kinase
MTPSESQPHSWPNKFRWAARGARRAVASERNFRVHLAMALAVAVAGGVLRVDYWEWCVLVLCVAIVLTAELFNTAIEHLARAITDEHNQEIRDALDTGGGAVLVAALGAAAVGGLVFVHRLGALVEWW